MFITLTGLLTDPICLANDVTAQEAVRKLAKLQTDVLKLTTEEIVELLEAAQNVLKKIENITETAIDEIRIYMENCRKDIDTSKQELSEHTGKCIQEFDENRRKFIESSYEQSCKDFQRRLMAHYNDTSSWVPLSNLDQSLDKRITDIYSTPKIHRIEIEKDRWHTNTYFTQVLYQIGVYTYKVNLAAVNLRFQLSWFMTGPKEFSFHRKHSVKLHN
ncbi:hypothetical protein DPMN_166809 [Dreissena polymorpha]|uniref:Uncharacterized protein n=1 Tax=Dreissena polymorpha TaxID=45954 RepID=A0A9D4IXY7_DREPO|nr:hypothetical protein DPMN_166809 [Dreissena polymorpha]